MEKIKEALHIAFSNLLTNAIRSVLSILGIVIGIAAVISILAIGAGARQLILDRMNAMGVNILTVMGTYDSATERMGFIELEDVERVKRLPFVVNALPRVNFYKEVRSRSINAKGSVVAVDDKYVHARQMKIIEGRNFSPIEIETRERLCLINEFTKTYMFPESQALGELIYIDGEAWKIIGVYGYQKSKYASDEIEILGPLVSLLRSAKDYSIDQIEVQVRPEAASEAEAGLLAEMERGDPKRKGLYFVRDQKSMFSRNMEIQKILSIIGTVVAGISLIVGGIGMMNVMLTSVAERTREIGLRRAVGARKKDILIQFLVESCVLSLAGGVLGLIAGAAVARALPFMFKEFFTSAPRLQPSFLFLSVACGILMGIIFGFYPAVKASKLSPAEALRSE